MKKASLAVLLPLAAGVALTATGFGAWVFAESAGSDMVGMDMALTPAVRLRDVNIVNGDQDGNNKNGFKFDQTNKVGDPSDLVDAFTVNMPVDADDGLVRAADNGTEGATGTTAVGYTTDTDAADKVAGTVTYDVTITLADTDDNIDVLYFIGLDKLTLTSAQSTISTEWTVTGGVGKATTSITTPTATTTLSDYYYISLKWNNKPTTYAQYSEFKEVLRSTTLTVYVDNFTVVK